MARPLRIEYPGALYHVTSRGNAGQNIFLTDQDRHVFLHTLGFVVERFRWICHAYCLMNNHYHLIIETPEGDLSRGMRQLNGIFTQKFNWLNYRTGHIFQGRFKAILVDKESYLLQLSRYVVLNPVRAGMVGKPEDWRWSSFLATIGKVDAPDWLTVDWLLGHFGNERMRAQQLFRGFAMEGMTLESPWKDLSGQIFLGGKDFIDKAKTKLLPADGGGEIPEAQRAAGRPTLEELLGPPDRARSPLRNRAIFEAHVTYGYRLKEVGDYLGLHYATVSKIVKKVEGKGGEKSVKARPDPRVCV